MNIEQLKRLELIKSLVAEQGADGDKHWLIACLETSEACCKALEFRVGKQREALWERHARVWELRDAIVQCGVSKNVPKLVWDRVTDAVARVDELWGKRKNEERK